MKKVLFFGLAILAAPSSVWAMDAPGKHQRNESKQEQENSGSSKKKQRQEPQDELNEMALFDAIANIDCDGFVSLLKKFQYGPEVIQEAQNCLIQKKSQLSALQKDIILIVRDFTYKQDTEYTQIKNIALRDLASIEKMKRLATSYKLLCGFVFPRAYFTWPGKNSPKLIDILENLIDNEQKKIQGACYLFTHPKIINLLKRKAEQGVIIEIIIDTTQNVLDALKNLPSRITIYIPSASNRDSKMHHKFILFSQTVLNKNLLWRGSFNITHAANTKHYEDVTIDDNPGLISQFKEQYSFIKSKSKRHPQLYS